LKEEIALSAEIIRDLQDESTPLSLILKRMEEMPFLEEHLQERIRKELYGFSPSERLEVEMCQRRIKRVGEWEPFFGPIEELERLVEVKGGEEDFSFEPGSVMLGEFRPEFLGGREEAESALQYLRRLRRLLLEALVQRYFFLTKRFVKHFVWWL